MTTPAVSFAEQYAELKREIAYRRRVFPRWVAEGKMPQHIADRRMAAILAAADEIYKPARTESPELAL